jgi:hypothetical protein
MGQRVTARRGVCASITGWVRSIWAGHAPARSGVVGRGTARHGMARSLRIGDSVQHPRPGKGAAWRGVARARRSKALRGKARHGEEHRSLERVGGILGRARCRNAGLGTARRGWAGQGAARSLRIFYPRKVRSIRGAAWQGWAWHCAAERGTARLGNDPPEGIPRRRIKIDLNQIPAPQRFCGLTKQKD